MKSGSNADGADPVEVLCVDDDEMVRSSVGRMLSYAGYAVTTAKDGVEAWTALQSHRFDLLISDYEMPGLDGEDLTSRARLQGMKLPIIIISGAPCFETKFEGEFFHPITLMRKPFTPQELLTTIKIQLSL